MKIQIVGSEKSQKCSSTILFLELFSGNLHDIPEELCNFAAYTSKSSR